MQYVNYLKLTYFLTIDQKNYFCLSISVYMTSTSASRYKKLFRWVTKLFFGLEGAFMSVLSVGN